MPFMRHGKTSMVIASPPFNLIARVLNKVEREQASICIVVPNWKSQAWFPRLMEMLTEPPFHLVSNTRLLIHPGDEEEIHPMEKGKRLQLMACKVSGQHTETVD